MQIFSLHWELQNISVFMCLRSPLGFTDIKKPNICIIQCKLMICFSILNFVPKQVHRLSVRPSLCTSIMFPVNVAPPKPLDVAISNFVAA